MTETPVRKSSSRLTGMVGRLAEAQYDKTLSPLSPWSHFRKGARSEARRLQEQSACSPAPKLVAASESRSPALKRPAAAEKSVGQLSEDSPKTANKKENQKIAVFVRPAAAPEGSGQLREDSPKTPKKKQTAVFMRPAAVSSSEPGVPDSPKTPKRNKTAVFARPAAAPWSGNLGVEESPQTRMSPGRVLRRPAAKVKSESARPAAAPVVRRRPSAAAAAKAPRALKNTAKCIRSRAYHRAHRAAIKAGKSKKQARELARQAHRNAL